MRPWHRRFRPALEVLEAREVPATIYYVDAVDGSDANAGTSAGAAWKSLAKVNAATFAAGDTVLFERGGAWNGQLLVRTAGTAAARTTFGAYGTGAAPVLWGVNVTARYTVVENLTVDHNKDASDAVLVRAKNVTLRNLEVRNGVKDGIDMDDADGILIDGLLIHHFLAGSFTTQADAHGIVATDTQGLTIRNTEVHHVSGDSFQTDPDRDTDISTNILIENSHFWTGPLDVAFNSGWLAGQRPGENAVDTKSVQSGWDNVPRMQITIRNVTAHGWLRDAYIANKAAFNMKEKIDAVFDGVTVYDNEIGFRLRGALGNANVTMQNVVLYNNEKSIRAEDDLANLKIYNSTFGGGAGTHLQFAGGGASTATWSLRNNAFLGTKPSVFSHASNRLAAASDFVNSAGHNYHLSANSRLLNVGESVAGVTKDRDGVARPQGSAYDVGAYELATAPTTIRYAQADAYVRKGNPTSNYGNATSLMVRNENGNGNDREAYFRFDLSGLSGTVSSAKLQLTPVSVGSGAASTTFRIELVAVDSWVEGNGGADNNPTGEITWNNRPPATGTILATWTGETVGVARQIDVTNIVRQELANDPTKRLTLRIVSTTPGSSRSVWYASREYGTVSKRPQLVIQTI
jgi:hypothetical protein